MKSKSKINKQLERKKNSDLVQTIIKSSKNKGWKRVAEILSSPRKIKVGINLTKINDELEGDKIMVIPGKVLSQGEIEKKCKVVALNFSSQAMEKLLKSKCEVSSILDEIKKNPEGKNLKILNAGSKNPMLSKTKEVFNKWK